jgi:hypothetical protein
MTTVWALAVVAIDGTASAIAPIAAKTYASFFKFVLLHWVEIKHRAEVNVPAEPEENSECLFSNG